jgi:pteridine reductase
MEIRGRTALVTGGARRIGRAIVLALADCGARIALTFRTSYEDAMGVVEEVRERGSQALAIPADLAESDAPTNVVGLARERFGGLDILVNCAAVFPRTPVGEVMAKEWNRLFAVNLRAPFLLAQAAAPEMRRAGGGVIVNLTDIYADRTLPDHAPYVASKAGLVALTRGLARDLAPAIRVNAVAPGAILWPEEMPEEKRVAILRRIPLGRKGEPEDVARAVVFCVESDYVTGQVITVDGGRLLG